MYPNLKQHSRLDAYISKLAQSENALSPKEWNSFVKLLDETLGGVKECNYCEKQIPINEGIFICRECSL